MQDETFSEMSMEDSARKVRNSSDKAKAGILSPKTEKQLSTNTLMTATNMKQNKLVPKMVQKHDREDTLVEDSMRETSNRAPSQANTNQQRTNIVNSSNKVEKKPAGEQRDADAMSQEYRDSEMSDSL